MLVAALRRYPNLAACTVPLPTPAPRRSGYRIQAKLVATTAKSGPILGIYREQSHTVEDISSCILHHPLIARAIPAVRKALEAERVPVHNTRTRKAGVRYVIIRASEFEKKVLITLVSSLMPLPRVSRLVGFLKRELPLAGLHLNLNRSGGNTILGTKTSRLWGKGFLTERYGKLLLAAPPTAFVQANTMQAARIYRILGDWSESCHARRALDLYCGVGGIALTLALSGTAVTGVEEVSEAVKFARSNARGNGLAARFCADSADHGLTNAILTGVELVVANPPRKGLSEQLVRTLATARTPNLLYLSCWAPSFARDAAALGRCGFDLTEIRLFDMLPQTEHIEILGLFRKA